MKKAVLSEKWTSLGMPVSMKKSFDECKAHELESNVLTLQKLIECWKVHMEAKKK